MRTRILAVLLAIVVLTVPAHGQDTRRPMTVDDALDMVQVGSPLMSPDGSWVLYSRRTLNWEDNEYETEYWRVPADGGEAFRYIGEDGGSAFQFSPDGAYLTFRRAVDPAAAAVDRAAGEVDPAAAVETIESSRSS